MTNEKPSKGQEEFDQFERNYSSLLDESVKFAGVGGDFFTEVKADELVDIARCHFGERSTPLNVLDVGSGPALIHQYLGSRLGTLTGLDISPGMITAAQNNNPENQYVLYDGMTLPFEDNSFDMAFTICVVHHVPPSQWQDYIAEMRRVIRPGGLVVVIEHNPLNPLTLHVVNNCEFDENAVLLKLPKTRALYKAVGFERITSRYILFTPFRARIFRWLDRVFRWLPLGAQYCLIAEK